MKKMTLVLFLVVAFCLIATVSPVAAAVTNTNPANKGINSTSPFWFPDYNPSTGYAGQTLNDAFKPVYNFSNYNPSTGYAGQTLNDAFKPVYNFSNYNPSTGYKGDTLNTVFKMPTIEYSTGGYYSKLKLI
jgi:hypothetical protein